MMPTSARSPSSRFMYLVDLFVVLVIRDVKLRYKRSILGIGWSLVNPLAQFLVFYVVFRWIIPVGTPDFAVFLLTGILAWNWFQISLTSGCAVITDNPGLLRQPGFATAMLPVIAVGTNLVNFLLALPVVAVVLWLTKHSLTPAVLMLPLIIAVQFLLTLSAVYVFATLHVPFRDTQYLLGIFLLLGFYVSPVLYPIEAVPMAWRNWFSLNPLAPILESYRAVLIAGRLPETMPLVVIAVSSAAILALSYRWFMRSSHRFVEEIGG